MVGINLLSTTENRTLVSFLVWPVGGRKSMCVTVYMSLKASDGSTNSLRYQNLSPQLFERVKTDWTDELRGNTRLEFNRNITE